MEIAWEAREDVNAGTPQLKWVRLVLSLAATRRKVTRRKGQPQRKDAQGNVAKPGPRQIAIHDVSVAFFHSDVKDELYVIPPPGQTPTPRGMIWRLKKALYGTRQASLL